MTQGRPPPSGQDASRVAGLVPLSRMSSTELRDCAIEGIRQGLAVFDADQKLLLFNRRYAELYALDPAILRVGMTFRELIDLRCAAGTGPMMPPEEYIAWRRRINEAEHGADTEILIGNGHVHAFHHEPIKGGGWVTSVEDVTERRQAEARVRHMARHDALTNLPNRSVFAERLDSALARLRGETRSQDHRAAACLQDGLIAVLFIDLDDFKDVNDRLGHAAGDQLLRIAASRIENCLRDNDLLVRFGGDEFAILLEDLTQSRQAANVASRVIDQAAIPFHVDGNSVRIGASVGVALYKQGDPATRPDMMLRQADVALYEAKAAGRSTFIVFEPGMSPGRRRRRDIERDLRRAIREGEFELHFQPILSLSARKVIGVEALARWNHPELGAIPPSEFIPWAEQTGLIGELGAWAIQAACCQAAHWDKITLAVNLSPDQVRAPGLVEVVSQALADSGLAPGRLELEITEGVLLNDTTQTFATLTRLRALGIRIVLDDFGTGYSSLSYLRRFPFDKLKIDRSFVAAMATDAGSAAIVQAIVAMSASLALRVTAEGIETSEQCARLRAMNCDEGQGFLFARPVPPADLAALIARLGDAMPWEQPGQANGPAPACDAGPEAT